MEEVKFYNVKEAPFRVYGACPESFPDRFIRLPERVAEQTSAKVLHHSQNTSGIRVRFATDSDVISIKVESDYLHSMAHMTTFSSAGFDLYEYTEEGGRFIGVFQPYGSKDPERFVNGYEAEIKLPNIDGCTDFDGKTHFYQINFPLYSRVTELYVGVREGAKLEKGLPYRDVKPLVYYGSSITQGAVASRPGNCHAAIISRRLGIDFYNLGFSGACRGEKEVVEYLATLDPSVYIIEYDHNSPVRELRERHAPLAMRLRETHPSTPIILATRPDYYFTEVDANRRRIVLDTYESMLTSGDKNVYFLDGSAFFDSDERFEYTADGVHPNDMGCFLMANALTPLLKRILDI